MTRRTASRKDTFSVFPIDEHGYRLDNKTKEKYVSVSYSSQTARFPFNYFNRIPGVRSLRKIFQYFFFDDVIDQIQSFFIPDDAEEINLRKELVSLEDRSADARTRSLKPYVIPIKQKTGVFAYVALLYAASILRLTAWRVIFFNIVATAWWLLFEYSSITREIIDDIVNLSNVITFFYTLIITQYVSITFEKFDSTNERMARIFSSVSSLGNALMSKTYFPAESKNDQPQQSVRIRYETPSSPEGSYMEIELSPCDALVHIQHLLKGVITATVQDFQTGVDFDSLPILPYQKDMLKDMNCRGVPRLETVVAAVRNAITQVENTKIIDDHGIQESDLNDFMNDVTESLAVARSSVRRTIPRSFPPLIQITSFFFCLILPVVLRTVVLWLQYVLVTIIIQVIYGFVLIGQQARNQLLPKSVNPYAYVPVDLAALLAMNQVDTTFEIGLRDIYRRNQEESYAQSSIHLLRDGKIDTRQDDPGTPMLKFSSLSDETVTRTKKLNYEV